jgi:thymidylate kinase
MATATSSKGERGGETGRLVVFEGADGVGKSTLAEGLQRHLATVDPEYPVAGGSFPGTRPGSLGHLVGMIQADRLELIRRDAVAPTALQVLHVAAHVDALETWIVPALRAGRVVLDRFWWSAYAYARLNVPPERALELVEPERSLWASLPAPTIFLVHRGVSLKPEEIDPTTHAKLDRSYQELVKTQREEGVTVHEIDNDASLDLLWRRVLKQLELPYAPL